MVDVRITVKQFLSVNNTTVDVTDSTVFAGKTPKAIVVFGGAAGSSQAAETVDARMMIGFAAGASAFVSQAATVDGVHAGTTSTSRWSSTSIINASNSGSPFEKATHTFITNGVRFTFDGSSIAGRLYTVMIIGGDDVSAAVGQLAPNGSSPVTGSVSGLGFTPDLLLWSSSGTNQSGDVNNNFYHNYFGAATATQMRCMCSRLESSAVAVLAAQNSYANDACGLIMFGGIAGYKLTVSSFVSGGFSYAFTATGGGFSPGGDHHNYLALSFGGNSVAVGDSAVPTTSQDQAISGLGFGPGALLFCGSLQTATGNDTTTKAGVLAVGAAGGATSDFTAAGQSSRWNNGISSGGTSDAGEINLAAALNVPTQSDTLAGSVAAMRSLDAGGFTLNWSQVSGTATKYFYVAIQSPQATLPVTHTRVTQSFAMMGVRTLPPVRVTQSFVMVGVKTETPPCLTQECDLWRITRTDGTVFRFTSHNRVVRFQGANFSPAKSLTTSSIQVSSELGTTDNLDLSGVISAAGIKESDLWAGLFDDATVEIFRIDWAGGTGAKLLVAGQAGSLEYGDTGYKFEVTTAGERLTQRPLLATVSPTCRYKLGEGKWPVNLADFTVTGTVTARPLPNLFTSARRRIFTDSSRAEAAGYFTFGKIKFTSGSNAGLSADIRDHNAGGLLVLMRALPFDIQVGDAYSLSAGCDKTLATCHDKFSVSLSFGGFPYLKGQDDLAQTPSVKV